MACFHLFMTYAHKNWRENFTGPPSLFKRTKTLHVSFTISTWQHVVKSFQMQTLLSCFRLTIVIGWLNRVSLVPTWRRMSLFVPKASFSVETAPASRSLYSATAKLTAVTLPTRWLAPSTKTPTQHPSAARPSASCQTASAPLTGPRCPENSRSLRFHRWSPSPSTEPSTSTTSTSTKESFLRTLSTLTDAQSRKEFILLE